MSSHAALARQKGASPAQVKAVSDPQRGPFTPRQKLGFRAAERLHRSPHEIDDAFYARLRAAFSDSAIIELLATAAAWEFFTRFVDALHIPTTPLARPRKRSGRSTPKG